MLAKDVMTTNVITVAEDTAIEDIAKLLLEQGISGLPVLDAEGRLLGIVSEGDLIRRREGESGGGGSWWLNLLSSDVDRARDFIKVHGHKAGDVMTRDVIAVDDDTPVGEVARILEKRRIKRVPVLRDGKLVGLISRANLLHGLVAQKKHPPAEPSADDRTIRKKILDLVAHEDWVSHGAINVLVNDGVVELWGLVDSDDERKALRIAVEEVAGVREVRDHLGSVPPYLRAP